MGQGSLSLSSTSFAAEVDGRRIDPSHWNNKYCEQGRGTAPRTSASNSRYQSSLLSTVDAAGTSRCHMVSSFRLLNPDLPSLPHRGCQPFCMCLVKSMTAKLWASADLWAGAAYHCKSWAVGDGPMCFLIREGKPNRRTVRSAMPPLPLSLADKRSGA